MDDNTNVITEKLTVIERNEMCKAFLAELDNRIDEFNASLPPGYDVLIDNPVDVLPRCSWAGKNLSVTLFHNS